MQIKRIAILSVPVTDQQVARRFYTEILDFEVVRDNPFENGQRWIELAPQGSTPTITLVTWFPHMPAGSIHGLVLETEDIIADHKVLTTKGVDISSVEEFPWGKFATFKDPDGNGWVLQEMVPQV